MELLRWSGGGEFSWGEAPEGLAVMAKRLGFHLPRDTWLATRDAPSRGPR
jgi:hypothetical protein